jgi:hypothetical protein
MICNQCKKEVDVENWEFCPYCGGSLRDEKFFLFFRKVFQSKRNVTIFIVAEIAVIVFIAFLFLSSRLEISRKNSEINQLLKLKQDVKVEARIKDEILPISYAGENRKLVELRVTSPDYAKLKVEVESPGIINKDIQIIDLKPESRIYYVAPDLSEEGYKSLSSSRKADVLVKIKLIGENNQEKIILDDKKEVLFYSRNDIIWKDDRGEYYKYATRAINKDRPEIKELVRKAADHMKELGGNVNAMVGSLGDKKEIERQMEAIFMAMSKDYKIKYIMSASSYDSPYVQKIKYPEEVIQTQSGLCIELSMLAAAAMEEVGLNPIIILTTGHAWAGVEIGANSNNFSFIETTALHKTSREAVKIAEKEWLDIKDRPEEYQVLRINQIRSEGISPIKY